MKTRDEIYSQIIKLSQNEFADIIESALVIENKLRLYVIDNSYIDIWLSEKRKGIYAYHWERQMIDGSVYRHNNLPDREAKKLKTFPKHFHNKKPEQIEDSYGDLKLPIRLIPIQGNLS